MEVYDESHSIRTDENYVLEKWRLDFENLYNGADSEDFESEHYTQSKQQKHLLENIMTDPLYEPNADLNRNNDYEEIRYLVMKSKSKSACGIDDIP